jgi:spore coat protein H
VPFRPNAILRCVACWSAIAFATAGAGARSQTTAGGSTPPVPAKPPPETDDAAADFFGRGAMVRVRIELDDAARASLRKRARTYARATVRVEGEPAWTACGVKLKGAAGSFRELDDRPGFTLHLGKFDGKERFHGLQRFHLNNGVQDGSRLCEWLGAHVFAAAGYPAPRVAHAHVWLDGRDLGLYVLREAFDGRFLRRTFATTAGNLYDGGFCQDIDQDLEKDGGDGGDDHGDLRALRELCREFDRGRTVRFERAVDVERLLDFCALEALVGHWDGYSQNRNNYRVWLPSGGASVFLPHGMDQLFGDAEAPILRHPSALVAGCVMQVPAWRQRYRQRLQQLLPLLAPDRLTKALTAPAARLRKEAQRIGGDAAAEFDGAFADLRERLAARHRFLVQEVKAPEPQPLRFDGERPVALRRWQPAAATDGVKLDRSTAHGGASLHVQAQRAGDEERHGAWRTSVLLTKGRYRLSALVRCEDVVGPAAADGEVHGGVTVRADDEPGARLFDDRPWQPLACEFEVGEFQRDVELALDLRGRAGRAWFRLDSLQLVRLPDTPR